MNNINVQKLTLTISAASLIAIIVFAFKVGVITKDADTRMFSTPSLKVITEIHVQEFKNKVEELGIEIKAIKETKEQFIKSTKEVVESNRQKDSILKLNLVAIEEIKQEVRNKNQNKN